MKLGKQIIAVLLIVLVAAVVAGLVWTRDTPAPNEDASAGKKGSTPATRNWRVDERPLTTAKRMAGMASTAEEQSLAHQALKVGDHEVDLAFFDALRTAQENPPPLTPEAKSLADRKTKAEQTLKNDQDNIAQLTRRLAAAAETQKDNLQDQIDIAKAQMDLDQDELDDATEDLEQAGGDPVTKIKRLKAEHDAAGHDSDVAVGAQVNSHESDYQTHTFLKVFEAWRALRDKRFALSAALDETAKKAERLSQRHHELTVKVEKEKSDREAARQLAEQLRQNSEGSSAEESKAAATAAIDSLKQYTNDQKNLADLGRRTADLQQLSELYTNWVALVETRERSALHHVLESVLWILLVLVIVYVLHQLIERLFGGLKAENKRIETLRAILSFSTQAIGAIVILFLIFGMPGQTTTILGLAGAGLTVAMKDFIMAFLGWFSLMGRNGIHVGDWVEINGVAGEVIEIGLLKTVLLETGNWTDAGHPTGRKVSFMNSFAIEGHFFNFTTSGQWMWDELRVMVPANQDPYRVIDGIQKVVADETEKNAHRAEEEWRHTTSRYRVQAFSAEPALNVVPSGDAVEVRVRYITRAYERHEMRKRLYDAVVKLMHGKAKEVQELGASG
jgi:small-conductance mechanosensitive channel